MCSQPVLALRRRLVAADLGLALQVADDGVDDLPGRQRGAGVVEVHDVLDTRRVGADALEVDHALRERVQRFEQVDRAARPVVAAEVERRQRVADVRPEQIAHLGRRRLVLRQARARVRHERRSEDRLRDGIARRAREGGAVACHRGVDGVAKRPKNVGAHSRILL